MPAVAEPVHVHVPISVDLLRGDRRALPRAVPVKTTARPPGDLHERGFDPPVRDPKIREYLRVYAAHSRKREEAGNGDGAKHFGFMASTLVQRARDVDVDTALTWAPPPEVWSD